MPGVLPSDFQLSTRWPWPHLLGCQLHNNRPLRSFSCSAGRSHGRAVSCAAMGMASCVAGCSASFVASTRQETNFSVFSLNLGSTSKCFVNVVCPTSRHVPVYAAPVHRLSSSSSEPLTSSGAGSSSGYESETDTDSGAYSSDLHLDR
jgi:hypothetical protein